MGLTLIAEAYGATFAVTAILVAAIAAAVFLGLYARNRKRRGRTWGKAVPALLVAIALIAGVSGGAARVVQQISGLQRQEGSVLTLDENTNHFPRQTDVDMAAFDRLIAQVGEERLRGIGERFAGTDMIERHRIRMDEGYSSSDMLAYYAWKMTGAGAPGGKGNAYYRAVMELDPRAIDAADAAGAPDPDNPLHGAIVMVKGNIAVDGLTNDSGSWALADATASADADVVRNLRAAGAIIAGRTNLSEFANFLTLGGPNGFSGRGGQALSPDGPLTVDPLGSSTGSATAIALDYADVTVATETSGSILAPAEAAGVVGLKASHQQCSIAGIVPIDDRVDSVGFIGRSARDVSVAHQAGCRAPAAGSPTADSPQTPPSKIMVLGDIPDSLRNLAAQANVEIVDAPQSVADLKDQLASVSSESILLGGFGPSLAAHLEGSAGSARTAGDIAAYYEANPDTAPYGDLILRRAGGVDEEARAAGSKELERAKKIVAEIDAKLTEAGVDALVTSRTNLAAFSLAGVPRITVPLDKRPADDITGTQSPHVGFHVTAARADALPAVLAIAETLHAARR